MAQRKDSVDAEHLDQVLHTRGYQVLAERLRQQRDLQLRALVKPAGETETAYKRGMIAGLELALEVPQILKREAKASGGER
jgi:hypothetical protein